MSTKNCGTPGISPCRHGFTLIEVAVSTLLVGLVLAGALALMGNSLRTQRTSARNETGPLLADTLLAEIMSLPYVDPETGNTSRGLESGEVDSNKRVKFDDVDDYENFTESTITDKEGNALGGYTGWSRSVRVYWADRLNGNVWMLYDTGLKRIKVTVTDPAGHQTVREALRSQVGALQQAPAADSTVVNWVGFELETQAGNTAHAGSNLLNHAVLPGTE